ncbi:methyltransferase domain-containing protein [Clostridium butyricum]|uniref:methyltransferase domain-containing protein n=1 Tax=Clostridium butyricum TaxID=1492 RepID=UPI0018A99024|nr:methyltransferase domain-containing protein [Clostridium butyricum]
MDKHEIKKYIETLISNEDITNAKELIKECIRVWGEDVDIITMKSVINIIEQDYISAKEELIYGLNTYGEQYDLLYNLAYIYNLENNKRKAYHYYLKVLNLNNDNKSNNELQVLVNDLSEDKENKDYISRKKILITAYIFPPLGGSGVQRTLKFVKYLRNYGYEPIVVTTENSLLGFLEDTTLENEIPKDIEIIRVKEKSNYGNDEISYMLKKYENIISNNDVYNEYIENINYYNEKSEQKIVENLLMLPDECSLWSMDVIKVLDRKIDFNSIDVMYTTSGPYSDHLIGYFLKEKYKKKWVVDFRDEWTNNPYIDFDKETIDFKIIKSMENEILQKCDKLITTTPLAKKNYVNLLGVPENKVICITNGYDEEDFKDIEVSKLKNKKFTITHNGMFYMVRNPATFLHAIRNLIINNEIDKTKIKINFSYTEGKEEIEEFLLDNDMSEIVKFNGYMNHKDSISCAINSDLLLLVVGEGEKNKSVYTGKIFEYLRMKRNILALSPCGSIVEALLKETNSGKNFDYNDIEGIQNYIKNMYDEWKDSVIKNNKNNKNIEKYERKVLTQNFISILEDILEEKPNCIENEKLISNNVMNLYNKGEYNKILNLILEESNIEEKYEEVIQICDFFNKNINDEIGIVYFIMGSLYNKLHDFEKAIKFHKKSLQLDANLADFKYKEYLYTDNYKENITNCIGCDCSEYEVVNVVNQSQIETNLGMINPLRIWVRCNKCGLIYCNPMPSEEIMNKYYEHIWKERRTGGKYTDVDSSIEFLISMSNERLEKLENIYNKKGTILDIGTGIGVFTGVAKERGWKADGLEFNEYDCNYAKKNFKLDLLKENFYDFSEDRIYDVVTMFEVIEHLRMPLKDLKKINTLVKKDGIFVLATPIADSLHGKKEGLDAANWYVVTHLTYFTFEVLVNYLNIAGFEVLEVNYSKEGFGRLEFYCKKY